MMQPPSAEVASPPAQCAGQGAFAFPPPRTQQSSLQFLEQILIKWAGSDPAYWPSVRRETDEEA